MDFCGVFQHDQRRDGAMRVLEQVGIADQAFKLPVTLSIGQQQRAAIARDGCCTFAMGAWHTTGTTLVSWRHRRDE